MLSIFSPDSRFMRIMSRVADLIVLNLCYLLTCVPVFTIGTASAALYAVCFRLGTEEGRVIRSYFRAFRDNFKRGTGVWLIVLLCGAAALVNVWIFYAMPGGIRFLSVLFVILFVLVLLMFGYAFPLLSQFDNGVWSTLRSALILGLGYLPRSLVITVLNIFLFILMLGDLYLFLQAALGDMYADGYDFSYLYPFSTAYYRQFGYECCVQKLVVSVRLDLLPPQKFNGALRLAEAGNPMTEAIRAVDACWERQYNMMVQHRLSDYRWTEEQDPAVKQAFTYVCFAPDGTPRAYTTFTKEDQSDGRNLVCRRFCFADREGFAGLMTLFKSLSADHRLAKFSLPASQAMQYLLPEWSMGAAVCSLQPAGMVRVINAESVLKKAAYIGDGSAVLRIRDPQIPENDRTFAVHFAQGQAASVEASREEPDGVLSISAFSALITGVCDFQDAAEWMDGLEVRRPEALSQVFYRKPMMIVDYF